MSVTVDINQNETKLADMKASRLNASPSAVNSQVKLLNRARRTGLKVITHT